MRTPGNTLFLMTIAFLGTLYDAAEALLEAAAKRLPAAAWAADAGLRARARAWRRRARRAALVARQLAPASDVAAQEEALALLDLGSLQGLPPAFDQRCRVRPRHAITQALAGRPRRKEEHSAPGTWLLPDTLAPVMYAASGAAS